jgi:hypothetical protein
MNWLADNYKWLFDGIGVAIVVGGGGFLLRRFFKRKETPTNAGSVLQAIDSHVSHSPVTSGSGNITNIIHVERDLPPAVAVVAPALAPAPPQRLNPNIQLTGVRVSSVAERRHRVWEEVISNEQALLIQFTNEPKRDVRNVGGQVKASLAFFSSETEVCRIVGSWLHEGWDSIEFRVDDSQTLIVGVLYHGHLMAFGRRRVDQTVLFDDRELPAFDSVRVRLTNANHGDLLYEGRFRVTVEPLTIAAEPD